MRFFLFLDDIHQSRQLVTDTCLPTSTNNTITGRHRGDDPGARDGASPTTSRHKPATRGARPARGAFYLTLVPIRPRRRGERRSLRTFPVVSLRPGSLAFNPRPRRLSTPLLTPFNSTHRRRSPRTAERWSTTSDGGSRTRSPSSRPPRRRWSWTTTTTTTSQTIGPAKRAVGSSSAATTANSRACARGRGAPAAAERDGALAAESDDPKVRSIHWSPYDRVGDVDADP